MDELLALVKRLRAPDGCPWDREQTPSTLAPHLIEEAIEVATALADPGSDHATEELGDVLFVALSILVARQDAGHPSVDEVAWQSAAKMRARHPRLFGDPEDDRSWNELKGVDPTPFQVSRSLPALLRAQRVGEGAASRGFDWPDLAGPWAKVHEELAELDEAVHGDNIHAVREELGDLLFSIVNVARHLGIDAETALSSATVKFESRFVRLEAAVKQRGDTVERLDATALESTWQELKETGE